MSMVVYSQDLRDRVLGACERGEPVSQIAQRLEVSQSWIRGVYRRFRETGERTARQVGGYRKPCLASWEGTIRSWLEEQADLTLEEMVERLRENGIEIVVSTLWYQLERWGVSFKKKPARPRTRTPRRPGTTR